MIRQLAVDPGTREVRLVFRDLWEGQHERTEYRVIALHTDEPVHERHPGEWDHLLGQPVRGQPPPGIYYVRRPSDGGYTEFRTETRPVAPTAKTPCLKAANRRRKCPLCEEVALSAGPR